MWDPCEKKQVAWCGIGRVLGGLGLQRQRRGGWIDWRGGLRRGLFGGWATGRCRVCVGGRNAVVDGLAVLLFCGVCGLCPIVIGL